MKKQVFVVVVMLLLVWMELPAEKISVGLTGGINLSNLRVPDDILYEVYQDEFSRQTVFGCGAVVDIPVMSYVSLQVQPLYMKRCSLRNERDDTASHTYKFSYLEIPVMVKGSFGHTIKPHVLAGASFGFNLGGEVAVEDQGISGTGDLKNVLEKSNVSLVVGMGVSYHLGKATLFANGLYFNGLININKGGPIDIEMDGFTVGEDVDPVEVKTRDFLLMAGIRFPLGKSK